MTLNIYFLIGICFMIAQNYLHDDYTKEATDDTFKKHKWSTIYHTPKDLMVMIFVIFWVVVWPVGIAYKAYQDIKYWKSQK